MPSIGYGTVALAVVDVAAAPGDWTINGTQRATHACASNKLSSQVPFTDSPLQRAAPSWARPPDAEFDEC